MSYIYGQRYTLFTMAATGAKTYRALFGNLGQFDMQVGEMVDKEKWRVEDIDYPGAWSFSMYTLAQGFEIGKQRLIAKINSTPGKFAFCGFSLGAGIMSEVYRELKNGVLQHRKDDLVAAVTFGNPSREAGHTIPGGIDPGGHGVYLTNNVGTEEFWWDFANSADPIVTTGDDSEGQLWTAVANAIINSNGYIGLVEHLIAEFSSDPVQLVTTIAQSLIDLMRASNGFELFDPNSPHGHLSYHKPYTGLPGNQASAVQLAANYLNSFVKQEVTIEEDTLIQHGGVIPVPDPKSYYDKWHFWVETVNGEILTKDLVVQEPQILRVLSGPSQIEFKVHPKEPSVQMPDGSGPIQFKPWGHIIHAMKQDLNGNEIPWASCIFQPSDIDPQTGIMSLRSQGFSSYAKGIPWLQNWNPIAVDPFQIVDEIWNHIQSYAHGNLGVTVYPTVSGTKMLPGFSFESEKFVQNFFAIFIRAVDRVDCGDYINKLARDIPFDYWEESTLNASKTKVIKKIRLAYPNGGVDQTDLIFRPGENVRDATQKQEAEIDWLSDITIKGYFPGKEYSSTIINADPERLRRVMDEQDLNIDSNERAAAWAKRQLTRRTRPNYFESIVVDPYHPNAPFGSYDVGDLIRYQGSMQWKGNIDQKHKVMMIGWDEVKGQLELKLKAEGAFNYDPIAYIPISNPPDPGHPTS